MSFKMAAALSRAKTPRKMMQKGAKKLMRSAACRALKKPGVGFALGAAVALPLSYALVRSLRNS
jgi:hypothetical protein